MTVRGKTALSCNFNAIWSLSFDIDRTDLAAMSGSAAVFDSRSRVAVFDYGRLEIINTRQFVYTHLTLSSINNGEETKALNISVSEFFLSEKFVRKSTARKRISTLKFSKHGCTEQSRVVSAF